MSLPAMDSTPPEQQHPPTGQHPPPPLRIEPTHPRQNPPRRLTSRRYASYWYAFLCNIASVQIPSRTIYVLIINHQSIHGRQNSVETRHLVCGSRKIKTNQGWGISLEKFFNSHLPPQPLPAHFVVVMKNKLFFHGWVVSWWMVERWARRKYKFHQESPLA